MSNIMARISYILMRWCLLCSWPTYLAGFFNSAQRNESIRVDISFYSLSPIPSQLLFLNAACLFEKQQIPILVWFWTQNLLHANHYTTDVVKHFLKYDSIHSDVLYLLLLFWKRLVWLLWINHNHFPHLYNLNSQW